MSERQARGLGPMVAVLRQRNFAIYAGGSTISLIGTWMQRVSVGWLGWELTQSGAWLGLLAFADLFPSVVVGPLAGAAADRWNKLKIARTSQILGMLQSTFLFVALIAGFLTIEILFAAVLFHGFVAAFNQPARLALIHSLVGREGLGAAVAINSIVFNLARFIGPAVAGLLIASVGVAWAFAANAVSFATFVVALMAVTVAPEDAPTRRAGFFREVVDGVAYSIRHPGIGPIFALMIAAGIGARPVVELLPGFAADVFQAGPIGLATLTSSVAVGAIAGGLWVGSRPGYAGLTKTVLASVFGMALAVFLFTLTDRLWIGSAALAGAGFFMVASGVGTQTLVQLAVDGGMRGRVLSLHGLIFRGGPALGALVMGVVSDFAGLRPPVAVGAALVAFFVLLATTRLRAIAQALEGDPRV